MADPISPIHEVHPFVYHYTTRAGLEGILSTQTIFATHFEHLNDTSEIRHMLSALTKELQHPIKSMFRENGVGNERLRRLVAEHGGEHIFAFEQAREFIQAIYEVTVGGNRIKKPIGAPYITSFCAHSDDEDYEQDNGLLSQWRGYTDIRVSGGFAMVFDTERLSKLLRREANVYYVSAIEFGDVIYDGDTDAFLREFSDFIKKSYDALIQNLSRDQENLVTYFPSFVNTVSRFKHRAFREEREVRIIISPWLQEFDNYLVKETDPTNYQPDKVFKRIFRAPNTEKLTVRLFDFDKEEKLPVVKIIIGPHRNQKANVVFAEALVERTGMDVEIRLSETPYTG